MQAETILQHHSSVYSIVTEQILKQLESGVAPWHRPWTTQIPKNLVSGRDIAELTCSCWPAIGYGSPYWLTYQAGHRTRWPRPQRRARHQGCLLEDRHARDRRRGRRHYRAKVHPASLLHACSTWSNARALRRRDATPAVNPSRNASASSGRCRIRQRWSKTDARGTGHRLTPWGCRRGMRSIQPRSITPRYSTS